MCTYNLDVVADGEALRYERFYYLCMQKNKNLVFDVQADDSAGGGEMKRVVLNYRVS